MKDIHYKLDIINEILIEEAPVLSNIGLLNGKMGICLYFYHLARNTRNETHQQIAEHLLDDVYEKVSQGHTTTDFEKGLTGIAWGIEYLTKNEFVQANTDIILKEVDDKIYRTIIASIDRMPIGLRKGALGYILYLIARLDGEDITDRSNNNKFIFKRVLIELVNQVGKRVEEREITLQEPFSFDITWDLPLCLILLSKMKAMDFYNSKINRVLEHLSPSVISLFPSSPSNRLYLLLSIEKVLKQSDLYGWRNHAMLLRKNIQLEDIIKQDLKNKNIHLLNGITGVDYISRQLYQLIEEETLLFSRQDVIDKIVISDYWEEVKKDGPERKGLGLLRYGLSGVGLELLALSSKHDSVNNPGIVF